MDYLPSQPSPPPKDEASISLMRDTLWKIIQRAKFPGDLDIRIMAAAALGLSLSDLKQRGIPTS